jgi:O-methyltransferase
MRSFLRAVRQAFRKTGFDIQRVPYGGRPYPPDFEPHEIEDLRAVRPYTMTSNERVIMLMRSVRYVVEHQIPGDIVECGVWRGGSMMAVARALLRAKDTSRRLWLFDTYQGMPPHRDVDVTWADQTAEDVLRHDGDLLVALLEDVQRAVRSTGYNPDRLHFIKGKVEDTIPHHGPEQIALLRLDTDWYESTLHELEHFYPRLPPGGVLIIDDYGCWKGARKAADEYISRHKLPLLLQRIDFTSRFAVKPGELGDWCAPNHRPEARVAALG